MHIKNSSSHHVAMKQAFFIALLFLLSFHCAAGTSIDPVSFEQIWLLNNQRNIFERYQFYNQQVHREQQSLYLISVDAAPDKVVKTSDGEHDALISRMNIHYQSPQYLFLIDWFSAIPQPQTTEGFTYGDLIIARSWQFDNNNSYFTFGLRQLSTPRSVVVNSERVFNATDDASKESYSIFLHYNYQAYNLGTYYSEDNQLEAIDLFIPLSKSGTQSLSSKLYYYHANPAADLSERYEISLDHGLLINEHRFRSGVIVSRLADTGKVYVSNIFTNYSSPSYSVLNLIAGAYYANIENKDKLPGAKLGVIWQNVGMEDIQMSFTMRQNAIGDFNALIIRDEPIFTFTLSSKIDY